MRKRFGKRIISLLLTFCILLSLLPLSVMAATAETETGSDKPFTDIEEGSWYYDAVMYAYANGLVNGVTPTTFDPQGGMTRGMFVTILGRMAGVDTTAYVGQSTFDDVDVNIYYAPYVAWAVKNGIVNGTGGNKYSPDMLIDRQQLATFFVRYCEAFGVEYGEDTVTTQPADIDEVADWAKDSVLKLWSKGILNGDGTNFNPADEATRAEAVTLSTRMDNAVETWYSEPGVKSDRVRIDPATGEPLKPEEMPKPPVIIPRPSDDPDDETTTSYLVEFGLVDGLASEIASAVKLPKNETYREGTKIEHLPAPSMQNGLLLGWYYDAAMTKPVPADATVTKSLKLYAKMGTVSPISEEESPRYITVQVGVDDVAAYSFKIKGAFDAADVTFINVSANNQEYTRRQTGELTKYDDSGAPLYEYKAVSDGADGYIITALWAPGQTYSIKLADDSPAVFVAGGTTHTTHIRTLNIITGKAETMELSVNDGIRYIAKDHTGLSGMSDSLKGLFTVSLESVTPEGNEGKPESEQGKDIKITPVEDTGTFTFTGLAELSDNKMVALKKGDTVAIYTGERPDKRGLTSDAVAAAADAVDPNGSVAYVEITGVEGDVFTYKTAESEDVLFTPDVLPLLFPDNGAVSLADTGEGGTFTVPVADMTYTDDIYAQMGLDSQTKVEAGDFIMFYLNGQDGTIATASAAGSNPYAKITKVVESDGAYTIDWVPATEAEVMAAMDLYDTRNQAIVQDDKKIEEMENEMVRQAIESGFVDEAAEYLAALALETDGFERMDGDMDLSSYSITFEDGTPVDEETMALMAGNKAEITKKEVAANIMAGPVLQHFEDSTGLRAELGMEFTVEVDLGNDNKIVIQLEAIFEQEVLLTINVSGGAVWKKAWIFPYIADYQMNANLDVGTYTGIGVTATVKTVAPEDEEEEEYKWESVTDTAFENVLGNVGEIIKDTDEAISSLNDKVEDLNSKIEELIDKGEHFLDIPTVEVPSVGINGTESVGTVNGAGLAELYSDMMSEATDNWIEIVRVEIFSSEGHVDPLHILCYGIGADFVVSATMHVTIGMTFQFGVAKRYAFSLKLFARESTTETIDLEEANYSFKFYVMGTIGVRAGIEFEVAVGLFSLKLDSIGIAAEVGAYAQMWGYFYYELTWSKNEGKDSRCSGALFIEIGIYLSVKFKAQLFSYDKLTYNPTLYENEWPLWSAGEAENVYDFYYPESPEDISEDDFKDEETEEIDTEAYEEEVAALTELLNMEIENALKFSLSSELFDMNYMDMKTGVLHGSDFEEEEEEDDGFSFGDLIPGGDDEEEPHENSYPKNYDSNQSGNGDADDEEHFIIELSNEKFTYDPVTNTVTVDSDELEETCEVTITWKGNALAFSTKPLSRTVTITWKNSEAARYINFDGNGGSGTRFISLKVNDPIPAIPDPTRVGYTFGGWVKEDGSAFTVPTEMPDYLAEVGEKGVTVYAKWTPREDIHYTVKYYLEELGGSYKLANQLSADNLPGDYPDRVGVEEFYNGIADRPSQVEAKAYSGFTAKTIEQKNIDPAGTTVIEVYYTRDTYTSTFNYGSYGETNFAANNNPIKIKAKYGATVFPSNLYLDGYIFEGYNTLTDDALANGFMVVGDAAYTAQWRLDNDTTYRIERYVERNDKLGSYMLATENAIATVNHDATQPLAVSTLDAAKLTEVGLEFIKITVNGSEVTGDSITISPDESTVIKLYHDRKSFGLTFDYNGGKVGESTSTIQQVKYGTKVAAPEGEEAVPTKTGWTFDDWYTKDGTNGDWGEKVTFPYTMLAVDTTLYAKYVEGTNTKYTVEHYLQDITGTGYTKLEGKDDTCYGKTNAEIAIADLEKEIITGASYSHAKVGDTLVEGDTKATIAADGNTVVKLYYDRTAYTVTFDLNGGTGTAPEVQTVRHGGVAVNPGSEGFSKDGYSFAGWYTKTGAGEWDQQVEFTAQITGNKTFYAKWEAKGDTTYTVNYYYMGTDGQYGAAQPDVKQDGVTDQVKTIVPEEQTGFTLNSTKSVLSGIVAADGSLILSVYYDRSKYTASFVHGDGTDGETEVEFYYGATITAPQVSLTRTGYDFAGTWAPAGNAPAVGGTMPAGDVTYNANWTPWTYTVKFNANTNETYTGTVADQTFSYGETKALSSGIFTREGSGYTMTGWNTKADGTGTGYTGGQQVNFSALVTGKGQTITLYAVWQQGAQTTYTVKYYKMNVDGNGYTEDETMRQTPNGIDGASVSVTPAALTGFTLNNSKSVLSGTVTDGGLVLEVYYDRDQHNVTVDEANGSETATTPCYYGATVTVPAAPSKTGYTFLHWSDGEHTYAPDDTFTMGTENVILTAQWDAATYTVSFDANMDGVSNPADRSATFGKTYGELPTLSKDGYTLEGWFTAETDGQQITKDTVVTATENHTLYAHWASNEYTVTFVTGEGGSAVDPITRNYGDTVELPIPTHTEETMEFKGWYYDQDCTQAVGENFTMPKGGTTLYAKWGIKTYTITVYSGRDGEEPKVFEVEHGGSYAGVLNNNLFGEDQWIEISGWFVPEDGDPDNYLGTHFEKPVNNDYSGISLVRNEDHVVKANWVVKEFKVKFDLDGGSKNTSANVDETLKNYNDRTWSRNNVLTSDFLTLPATPSKTGYTFQGWRCSANDQLYGANDRGSGENTVYDVKFQYNTVTEAADITFKAEWKVNTYTVYIYQNEYVVDGTNTLAQTIEDYSIEYGNTGAFTLPALDSLPEGQVIENWKFRVEKWVDGDLRNGWPEDAGAVGETITFEKMIANVTTGLAEGNVIKLYPTFAHPLKYIDTIEELQQLSALYANSNTTEISKLPDTIYLNADITLPSGGWVAIGKNTNFNRNFDGQGHTITMASGTFQPLFYVINANKTVKNLNVKVSGVTADSTMNYWGVIAYQLSGKLNNCKVIGAGNASMENPHITANGEHWYVGILAGYVNGSGADITDCYVMGESDDSPLYAKLTSTVDSTRTVYIGGMVGWLSQGTMTFSGSGPYVRANIDISRTNAGSYSYGGIVGMQENSTSCKINGNSENPALFYITTNLQGAHAVSQNANYVYNVKVYTLDDALSVRYDSTGARHVTEE